MFGATFISDIYKIIMTTIKNKNKNKFTVLLILAYKQKCGLPSMQTHKITWLLKVLELAVDTDYEKRKKS